MLRWFRVSSDLQPSDGFTYRHDPDMPHMQLPYGASTTLEIPDLSYLEVRSRPFWVPCPPRNRFADNNTKGSWCGLSAAFLWVAEGTAITSFASEDKKGLYVSIFWSIFQCGVVIGAAIPVGQNWNAGTANGSRVNDGTYVGLFILMLCGLFLVSLFTHGKR